MKLTDDEIKRLGQRFLTCVSPQYAWDLHITPNGGDGKWNKYFHKLNKGDRVLFVGCGGGNEVSEGKKYGFSVAGCTLGEKNIEHGRNTLGLSEDEIFEGLGELLPFGPEEFDAVIATQMLEHTVSPIIFLLEQNRVLKTGGKIILEWPAPRKQAPDREDNPQHLISPTAGQGRSLLLKSGFGNVQLYYENMSPIPESSWWKSETFSYVIAIAEKIPSSWDYVNEARTWK
jgi:SAM-dependent methyltransferase